MPQRPQHNWTKTMAYITQDAAPSAIIAQRIAGFVQKVITAAERRAVYRTTYAELSQLSNRELADMGMNRSMIKQVAMDAAYGVRG